MSTFITLSNDASDVSGYLLAYIGTRSPIASTTSVSVATTTSAATATTVGLTLTAGGTGAKWITRPFGAAVTINTAPFVNYWYFAVAASANAFIDTQLFKYTGGAQANNAFLTSSLITSATTPPTAATRMAYLGTTGIGLTAMTSTAFAVNDRLVIQPFLASSSNGVQAAGTVRFDYHGGTEAADGDSFLVFDQDIQTVAQQGMTMSKGPSLQHFENLRVELAALSNFVGQAYSTDAKVEAVLNELAARRDAEGA